MKPIVVQFSYQRDLGADLIRWFGHGAGFSHVDAVLDDGRLLGARSDTPVGGKTGVQIRPADYADFDRKLRIELQTGGANAARFYDFVKSQIGKPYDMRAIVGFATGRDWHDPDRWFCSELIGTALEEAGFFGYPLSTPANKLDPDDLLLAISALVDVGLHVEEARL